MLEEIINLTAMVKFAENGHYQNRIELLKDFQNASRLVCKYRALALESYEVSLNCEHEEFNPPYFYVIKDMFGGYYLQYHKTCTICGKDFVQSSRDGVISEGYGGAKERYYNNNI